jgi:hypothetical protein
MIGDPHLPTLLPHPPHPVLWLFMNDTGKDGPAAPKGSVTDSAAEKAENG